MLKTCQPSPNFSPNCNPNPELGSSPNSNPSHDPIMHDPIHSRGGIVVFTDNRSNKLPSSARGDQLNRAVNDATPAWTMPSPPRRPELPPWRRPAKDSAHDPASGSQRLSKLRFVRVYSTFKPNVCSPGNVEFVNLYLVKRRIDSTCDLQVLSWVSITGSIVCFILGLVFFELTDSAAALASSLDAALDIFASALVLWRYEYRVQACWF